MEEERLAVLLDVIEEEERYYRQLKQQSLAERDALAKGELEAVDKGRERCKRDIAAVQGLSAKRQELVDELGLGGEEQLFDDAAVEGLEREQAARLRQAGEKLKSAADELYLENRRNLQTAQRTLDYLNFSLKAFDGEKEEPTYGKDARGKAATRDIGVTKLVDRQA